jgi:hypothetical protein
MDGLLAAAVPACWDVHPAHRWVRMTGLLRGSWGLLANVLSTPPDGFEPSTGCLEGRAFVDNKPVTATVLVILTRRWVKTG